MQPAWLFGPSTVSGGRATLAALKTEIAREILRAKEALQDDSVIN